MPSPAPRFEDSLNLRDIPLFTLHPSPFLLPAMKCPFCKADDTQVIDPRENEDGDTVRRRRRCAACEKRFTTYERVELQLPQVVKKNGSRAEFQREKCKASMMLALRKRPVTTESLDAALDRIEERLVQLALREVASERIGEMVMRELKKLDNIAYIRFASVYRNFEDVDEFSDAIREVKKPQDEKPKPPEKS
jgi:transcriptional repressor NrdR